MSDETESLRDAQEEGEDKSQNILRGSEIPSLLQELDQSHNPFEKAIAIKFPLVFNDFENLYVRYNQEELENRYPHDDPSGLIEISYLFSFENGMPRVYKRLTKNIGSEDAPDFSEEVVDAEQEEVDRFFSKYALTKNKNGDFILFGGDYTYRNEAELLDMAAKLENLHLDVQRTMGIKGRPQIFLFRDGLSGENGDWKKNYIDVVFNEEGNKEVTSYTSSSITQLARDYIEDYELINNSRDKVILSPALRKLKLRVERYKRFVDLGIPNYIHRREEELVNESLQEVYKEPIFRILMGEVKKPPTIKDLVELGFNIKQLFPIGFAMAEAEMPYIFREGMAQFLGMKMSNMKIESVMKDAIQTLGGYSSGIDHYYENIFTDDYATRVMPAMLWHLSNHFGLSMQDIANAVSQTSHKDFSFDTFFKALDIDPNEAKESCKSEMQRNLPR